MQSERARGRVPRAWISVGRGDDEQLVGAIATEDDVRRQLAPEQVDDGQQRAVAGRVAVRLVEQPEVVDVDEGDGERASRPLVPRSTDRATASTRAPWFRVSVSGSRRVASTRAWV